MKTVIYADVYFIVNFSMDFVSLFSSAKITKQPIKLSRLICASALGGIYAICALFIEKGALYILSMAAVPIIMCMISFGFGKPKDLLINTGVFFIVSFLMGGVISGVYMATNKFLMGRGIYVNGTIDTIYSDLPLWSIALLGAVSAFAASVFGRFSIKRKKSERGKVTIVDGLKSVEFTALCDTGNLLKDPVSSLPVIIVNKKVAEKLLPSRLYSIFEKNDVSSIGREYALKIRIIPVSGVKSEGIILGYIPEYAVIFGKKRRVCVALDTENGDFDSCDGIIPLELI